MKKYCQFQWDILAMIIASSIILSPLYSPAQQMDSLRNVIASQPDSREKATNLIQMAKYFLQVDKDSALFYSVMARQIAEKLDFKEAMIDADLIRGRVLNSSSKFEDAIACYERAVREAELIHDSLRIAKATYNAGLNYKELSDLESALDNYKRSLGLYLVINDSLGIMANYNSLGITYIRMSNYDSAAIYINKAINICENAGYNANLGTLYRNLGEIFLELEQYNNARKYVLKGFDISNQQNSADGKASAYILLGRVDTDEGNQQSAMENYKLAEKIYLESGDSLSLYNIQNNIGVLYMDQHNLKAAADYFTKALEGYRKLEFTRGVIVVLGNQSAMLSDQGRYKEALAINDTVLKLAAKHGYSGYRKDALNNISDNYAKMGNYKKAFEYQTLQYNLKDSIFTIEKEDRIANLLLKYEKEKDQARILALQNDKLEQDVVLKQKTLQRNAFLYAGLTILALAVFLFLYIQQRRIKDRVIAQQKILQLEEEKKLMAAKLLVEGQEEERKRIATELHDGLGVLLSATKMQFSTIRDKSPENRELIEKATRMLEQASGDVRKISHNMMPGLLTKLGFYEAVEDLFEKVNDTSGMNAVCEISGEQARLSENREIMLYRIIQEMVNNTLKHAKAANIRLHIEILPQMLDIVFADDGVGFDFKVEVEAQSLGLKNIQSRVHFLNGTLTVDSHPGEGVKYYMQVPL